MASAVDGRRAAKRNTGPLPHGAAVHPDRVPLELEVPVGRVTLLTLDQILLALGRVSPDAPLPGRGPESPARPQGLFGSKA